MKKKQLLNLSDAALDRKVKIQGTIYDRKRKLNNFQIMCANAMLKSGKKPVDVANHFNVDLRTLRYNTDETYKKEVLTKASGKHTGKTNINKEQRVEYKRYLVEHRANVIVEE